MKNEEMKKIIKKGIRTRRFQDISELLFATYRILDSFAPVVEHAKEMTDEFNDFPND